MHQLRPETQHLVVRQQSQAGHRHHQAEGAERQRHLASARTRHVKHVRHTTLARRLAEVKVTRQGHRPLLRDFCVPQCGYHLPLFSTYTRSHDAFIGQFRASRDKIGLLINNKRPEFSR